MAKFKIGDKVKLIERDNFPTPPGYILANAEGVVEQWVDWDAVMSEFEEYVYVKIEKAEGAGKAYVDTVPMFFHEDFLEKI